MGPNYFLGTIVYLMFFVSIVIGIVGIVFLFINEDRKKQGIKILKFAVPVLLISLGIMGAN